MSLEGNADGDDLERTANVPSPNNFTFCAWIYGVTNSGVTEHFMNLDEGGDNGIEFQFNSTDLRVWDGRGGITSFATDPPNRTGEWIFVSIRSSGTGALQCKWATFGTSFTTHTSDGTGTFSAASYEFSVLAAFDTGEHFNGRIAHVKVWDAELTDNELYLEMYSQLPVRLANLNLAWRVISTSSVTDIGPNARSATVNGTLALAEDPPIDDFMWCPQFGQHVLQAPAASPLRWLRGDAGRILVGDAGRYLRAA